MKSAQKRSLIKPNKNPTKSLIKKRSLEVEKRLTREEQVRVIQWLVELKPCRQIRDLIKSEFGKELNHTSIWQYAHSRKWRPLIKRLQERFEKSIAKIPIANKAHRVRYLQKILTEALTWTIKGYSKDGSPIYELKLGAATEAIKAARDELEGTKGGIIVNAPPVIIIERYKKEPGETIEITRAGSDTEEKP